MEKFKEESVLTDMNVTMMPTAILQVKYGDVEVNPGMTLTPKQVRDQPLCLWDANRDEFYTIVLNDPDAPSREDPKFREWHHWCVVNVPGNNISAGEVLAEYIGSAPRQGSSLHRYVFLVYKQPKGRQEFAEPRLTFSPEGRRSHSIAKFATKHGLVGPIAGNFYQAEWDESVPQLHERMGLK